MELEWDFKWWPPDLFHCPIILADLFADLYLEIVFFDMAPTSYFILRSFLVLPFYNNTL